MNYMYEKYELYEFIVVYIQREKHSICYTATTCEVNTFKNKNNRKSLRNRKLLLCNHYVTFYW